MPLLPRDPNAPKSASMPVSRAYGLVVLLALIVLVLLRHLFGSLRVEVGTK